MKSKPERRQGNEIAALSELSSTCPANSITFIDPSGPHPKRWFLGTYVSLWQTLKYHLVSWWPWINRMSFVCVCYWWWFFKGIPTLFQVQIYQPFGHLGPRRLDVGKVMECLDVDLAMRCKIYLCKKPSKMKHGNPMLTTSISVPAKWIQRLQDIYERFHGVVWKGTKCWRRRWSPFQRALDMTRSFSIPLILMMMLMVVVMMLTVLSSEGGLGASPLIQVSNSNMTPDFIAPNTANRYRYVVLYATLVKFHLTIATSMDCVNLVLGKRVQSKKVPHRLEQKGRSRPNI